MGRTIFFEKSLEDSINQLFSSQNKLQVGLILGQQSESKDFGLHLVRCPDPVDDEAEIEMSSSEDDVVVIKTNKKKMQDEAKTKSSNVASAQNNDTIDIKWVAEHGRQVNRMLTGGTSILGMFVYCTPEILVKNQPKLPQCLLNLQKRIERNKWLRKGYMHNEKYLLHVCSLTRKLTCRTVNTAEDQATLKPAEFRFQSFLNGWSSVSCVVDTSINICVPISQKAAQTEQIILLACQGEIERIWDAYASIDYKLVNDEQVINNTTSKSSKGKQEEGKQIKIALFKTPFSKQIENVVSYESTNLEVKLFGSIQARAFLHSKATYGDAVKALKVDIIRSLLTRIELLCEEAEVNNLDHVEEWSLVSPTRVFVPYQNGRLLFCDYSFKDESIEDISGRFAELLNIKPSTTDLISAERSPDVSEVSMIFNSNEKATDQQSDIASEISNSLLEEPKDKKLVFFLIALVVLLIGIALHLTLNN